MECCMMWNVCGLDGLQCEMVQNGVVKKSVWCEMVVAVWCGTSWCDFKCFVVWIRLRVAF